MLTRRTILGGASASLALISGSKVFAQTAPPLSAVITLNGQSFTYDETSGRDLGDFVSDIGGFTQRCVRCDVSGCPITVFFRADRTSDRVEVVFELGRMWGGTPANLGAYTVSISRGGALLTTVNVPVHYWYSRWRWQSAPRPIVGNVANLISQGLLPPYNVAGGSSAPTTQTVCAAPPYNPSHPTSTKPVCTTVTTATTSSATPVGIMTSYTPYAIMGLAGVSPYMPQTGERDDIGLVTESQAQFICTGAQIPLACFRAQAEAAGTAPWHLRDENTNAPLNYRTYANASTYSASVGNPYIVQTSNPITIDPAHMPALAYVPYVLTGDPYHLEDLQFMANWCWGSLPPNYRPGIPQSRAFAWSMRTLAQCARMTPGTVPSWLLPQSYWVGFLEQYRQWLEAYYVNSTDPVRALFRSTADINAGRDEPLAPAGTWVDPWQEEFIVAVMGWIISMGFTNWQNAFNWKIGSTIARTGTTSGWIRADATPYRMILRSAPTAPIASSWAEAWSLSVQIAKLTYTDPNTWADSDLTYLGYSRGALVYGTKLGISGISDNLSWATDQIVSHGWKTPYKWRIGTGL